MDDDGDDDLQRIFYSPLAHNSTPRTPQTHKSSSSTSQVPPLLQPGWYQMGLNA